MSCSSGVSHCQSASHSNSVRCRKPYRVDQLYNPQASPLASLPDGATYDSGELLSAAFTHDNIPALSSRKGMNNPPSGEKEAKKHMAFPS